MTTVLTDLQAGHEFEPISFSLDSQRVRDYLAATGDTIDLYEQQVWETRRMNANLERIAVTLEKREGGG